jgi:hypothetical protein
MYIYRGGQRDEETPHYSPGLGRGGESVVKLYDENGTIPDIIDMINDDSASGNVDKVHHTYFDLSRGVIEDIRELIVFGRRAKERKSRLIVPKQRVSSTFITTENDLNPQSHLYHFLIAPPYYHH